MSNTLFGQTIQEHMPTLVGKTDSNIGYYESGTLALKPKRLKTAAYARVSTGSDMQENSLENQIIHYTNYIRSNPEYQFAGIYSDRGKTGTKTASRTGFKKLVRDALDGKIDLILCKSISRFARNVVDTIDTIRLLKENGVRVIFEREGIDTEDMKSEFILTILAALAEEESRSISENISWSLSKRFESGEPIFSRILGYTKIKDNAWIIVEEEAKIVREAYSKFLKGYSTTEIARLFIQKGYKKANGRIDWSSQAIKGILKNERYVGDAMCQKTYTKDYLSHKAVINDGDKTKYLIRNHHEPIIDRFTYDRVQDIISKNTKKVEGKKRKTYPLSGRLICGECGGNFQRYVCREVVTWRCGNSNKSKLLCRMGGIKEKEILDALTLGFNKRYKLYRNKLGKELIIRLINEIRSSVSTREFQQNQLRLELGKALLKENTAILNGNEEEIKTLTAERITVENKIAEQEIWWEIFDKDDEYRKEALSVLETMKQMEWKIKELKDYIKDIKFLRAWVVRIKILSPFLFSITWLTGEETEIKNYKKGER